jgi:hypothetical protein
MSIPILLPDLTINGCIREAHCSECHQSFYGPDKLGDPDEYNAKVQEEFASHVRIRHVLSKV